MGNAAGRARSGTFDWPAKIHDSLRFLEPKRLVHRVSHSVFYWRIGRKFATTLSRRPALNLRNESTRHALTPCSWRNVQPFQENDR